MITWEEEPSSGIRKEVSDQYAPAPFMPGATMVPSARPGDHGGQMGQDPMEPLVQIIDPYMPDGGQILDLRPHYAAERKESRSAPSPADATKNLLALGAPMSEAQPQLPAIPLPGASPIQPIQPTQPPTPQVSSTGAPNTIGQAPLLPPVGQAIPLGHPADYPQTDHQSAPQQAQGTATPPGGGLPSWVQGAPGATAPPMQSPMAIPGTQLPQPQFTPPPQAPAAPQAAAPPVPAPVQAAPPPEPILVEFVLPSGGKISCYYHAVVRQEDSCALVLVTDTRGGQMVPTFEPPISMQGAPMTVQLPVHGIQLRAYSVGAKFSYDGRDYLMLIVDENTEAPYGEDGTAVAGGV